ncbi:uncharacterized protein I206_100849 [Kwoniella pini CBS 10737]|uniref:GmrSD restriction endonucleases N-terminal domain-containing protein n=1 Tax=Kwoniella pini CBS 10737 TaxID=1296096 RepID=A0A1B9ICC4_9TREE|nr:uncharacterized protein I206_00477 [Kwoniella pini CBS 10737]OCF53176.1 hypothetical protein I206_00477 [Kwoniella pini CBS 10737]
MPSARPSTSNANQTAAGALSDDSDLDDFLDELSSDNEDVKPKKKGPPNVAEILKGQVGKPHNLTLSCKSLHDMIHTGRIDLEADYQRGVVWTEAKMIGLIQSLFLNYYVPPILFAVSKDEVGEETRLCIDGKQRCTSIQRFMDGQIPFISPNTKVKYWYTKFEGHRGKQLPKNLKDQFDLIQMMAVDYYNMSDEQQRDVFQRVQLGVQLSAAEKLAAHAGPWTTWINELEKRYVAAPDTLGDKVVTWNKARGRPFQNLLGFIVIARESTPSKIFLPSGTAMRNFVQRADPPDNDFKIRAQLALSIFINIAYNYREEAFNTTTTSVIAPVEFWFIGYLIYSRMGFLSVRSLAEEIGKMRAMIRRHVPGNVSANGLVFSLLSDFVRDIPKKRKNDDLPAAEQYEQDEDVDQRDARALKRSRRAEDTDPTYNEDWTERTISGPEKANTRGAVGSSSNSSNDGQQARPAPVNVAAAANARTIAGLPTPRTSGTTQPQVYNQQPANGHLQQSQQTNGLGNTSQQWREYTQDRVKALNAQALSQSHQVSNQAYGR